MAKKSYLKSTFDFLSEDDLKFLAKKTKLSLEKTSSLIEEWDDFFSVLDSLSAQKIKTSETKKLSPSFVLVKRIIENCNSPTVSKSEKSFFVKKIQHFFMKMILGDPSLKKISFEEPNLDRSFATLLSVTIFKENVSEKIKKSVQSFSEEIDDNIVKGLINSGNCEAIKVGKNFKFWKNCLNQVIK